jgi:membrane protease YdiL (CAAX protease family)
VSGTILLHLGVFFAYSIAVSFAAFLLPPAVGLIGAVGILVLVLRFYVLGRGADAAEREAALRLRPLRGAVLTWTLAAAPVMLLLSWTLGDLYVSLVPVPERVLNPFGALALDPLRWLVLAVVAIASAPLVEEMFFRGLIQHPMEERLGAGGGIAAAALLFALVHVDTLPWVIPLHFFLGAVFGWAVYVTRSIWAGVILHAVNNSAAFLGLSADASDPRPTIWQTGPDARWWTTLLLLAVAVAAGVWVAGRLREAARQ